LALDHRIFKIKGVVQHYSWGGYDFIPNLLGMSNEQQKPFAEYWLGAHPNHPSLLENKRSLPGFIQENPFDILGESVAKSFSTLPFLFKILDVRQMLSIQVHPGKQSAITEFEKENQRGIPVTAPHRNYKDENHKPELMVALSDFWLLHGFKQEDALREILASIPTFDFLLRIFNRTGYQGLYEEVMTMSQERVNEILGPIVERIVPLYKNNEFRKDEEDFWVGSAVVDFCKDNNYDRGIFSIYFFNLLHLKRGEGIFQPQGMPHAYLEGQNVEVMANSDNVLRAGLTDKHVDVPELMKHVDFKATAPNILSAIATSQKIFSAPVKEFELHQYHLDETEKRFETRTAEIWFWTSGSTHINDEVGELDINRGEALFISAETNLSLKSSVATEVFRVLVPDNTKNQPL